MSTYYPVKSCMHQKAAIIFTKARLMSECETPRAVRKVTIALHL
ncbi:hypothetical protein [Endozoicomonas sp. 2B-B]